MASNAVIGNIGFSEGVHYWEVICPIFCNSIGKSLFNRFSISFPLKFIAIAHFFKVYLWQIATLQFFKSQRLP